MRVFVLGLGKSGTTALLHKLAASLPGGRALSGGEPGSHPTLSENAVFKHTFNPEKGRTLELFRRHLAAARYERKIWIARDPRDQAISAFLYRWYRGLKKDRGQYRECLDLVRQKEREPRSVPFYELYRHAGERRRPRTLEEMVAAETARYETLCELTAELGDDWFRFHYEDMVERRFDALEAWLGFPIAADAEVPKNEQRIARRKTHGDWRHWYTEADCRIFAPIYTPYMEQLGYDTGDWSLADPPVIDPRFASEYMMSLARRDPLDSARRLRKRVLRRGESLVSALLRRAQMTR